LRELFTLAQEAQRSGQLGQVAPFDPAQIAGMDYALQMANLLPGASAPSFGAHNFLLNAPDIASNPALPAYTNAAIQPLIQQLMETILPQIRGEAVANNMYGVDRQGIAEGEAVGRTMQAAGNTTANIMNTAYGQGLQASLGALGLTPQMIQLLLQPASIMTNVGTARQGQAQRELGETQAGL
jgi:hypothetical protein